MVRCGTGALYTGIATDPGAVLTVDEFNGNLVNNGSDLSPNDICVTNGHEQTAGGVMTIDPGTAPRVLETWTSTTISPSTYYWIFAISSGVAAISAAPWLTTCLASAP